MPFYDKTERRDVAVTGGLLNSGDGDVTVTSKLIVQRFCCDCSCPLLLSKYTITITRRRQTHAPRTVVGGGCRCSITVVLVMPG